MGDLRQAIYFFFGSKSSVLASSHTDRAAALIHPDAALLLLSICGLKCQQVPTSAQAVIVAQHAHNQVQRVSMQNILAGGRIKSS